jgi:hypothetical protein
MSSGTRKILNGESYCDMLLLSKFICARCARMMLNMLMDPLTKSNPFLSYLINFEEAALDQHFKPTCWAHLGPHLDDPDKILQHWGLESRELRDKLESKQRRSSPRQSIPRQSSPEGSSPGRSSPRQSIPRQSSPEGSSPGRSSPKQTLSLGRDPSQKPGSRNHSRLP